jgi:flagellin
MNLSGLSNLAGLSVVRHYNDATRSLNRSFERLSTGQRINRASDDPAGLIASQNLGAQSIAIRKEIDRLERESIVAGAKEGALSVVSDLLVDLDSLVVQAANKGALSTEERESLQGQADAVIDAIRFTYDTAAFNGSKIFSDEKADDVGVVWAPPKVNADGTTPEPVPGQGLEKLNLSALKSGGRLNLIDGDLGLAQELTRGAVKSNATARGGLGALQKTFYQPQINQLSRELEGVDDARSKIKDTDFAKEAGELVRSQVLQAAALKVIEVFRQTQAQTVLGLLGGVAA